MLPGQRHRVRPRAASWGLAGEARGALGSSAERPGGCGNSPALGHQPWQRGQPSTFVNILAPRGTLERLLSYLSISLL